MPSSLLPSPRWLEFRHDGRVPAAILRCEDKRCPRLSGRYTQMTAMTRTMFPGETDHGPDLFVFSSASGIE